MRIVYVGWGRRSSSIIDIGDHTQVLVNVLRLLWLIDPLVERSWIQRVVEHSHEWIGLPLQCQTHGWTIEIAILQSVTRRGSKSSILSQVQHIPGRLR